MVSTSQDALLAHIVSQTRSNIDFLISQSYITTADAEVLTAKLSSLDESRSAQNPINGMRNLSVNRTPQRVPSPPRDVLPPAPSPIRRTVPPPPPRGAQARALWDYNAGGEEPNDLSFRSGDTIEIVSETNPDWWTGKLNGKQGIFPSNYVEKISTPSHDAVPRNPVAVHSPQFPSGPSFPSPYGGAPVPSHPSQQWHAQPPPQQYYSGPHEKQETYMTPPPGAPVHVQEAPVPEKKKKFGGLGKTMATSAAGGVGFGAGAAVGSGIINSIF